jgi:predicted amidophosphoribosyltransferase
VQRRPHHIHLCEACQKDWDHYDSGCAAPLAHRCLRCWQAFRAAEVIFNQQTEKPASGVEAGRGR